MASRKRISEELAGNAPDDSTEIHAADLAPDDDPEQDALAELRGLGGAGEHKYTVSRVSTEPGKKSGYCKTYAIGDLSPDNIRDEFGGGKYRIRVTDSAGRFVTQTTLDIVDLPKPANAPVAQIAPGADLSGIAALLNSVKPAAGGDGGMTQILVAMIASQGKMMEAIAAAGNKDKGPTVVEIIAMMKTLQPEKSASDPVELLMRGLELGKSLGGGGESSMLDVAREGLGILGPLIQQNQKPPTPVARPTVPALAAPVVGTPNVSTVSTIPLATNPPEGANVKLMSQLNWIRAQLNVLVHHAARDKSPELYAEVLLDNLPPFITPEEITEHIGAPDALAKLAQIDARVNQHLAWFEEFRQAINELLSAEDEELPEDDGVEHGGDMPNLGVLDKPGENI
jgi:hypothetical protein